MQQLLKVLTVTVPTGLCAFSVPPLAAADRVALLGCDLVPSGGPTATFLQIGGQARDGGRGFVSQTGRSLEDVRGRSCAQVSADLADDGFEFRGADVSGRLLNQWVSVWQSNH